MNLTRIYQCFCDETRLRILHLLALHPLCVCHLQSILELGQVPISKHLSYLRRHGMVEARRHQHWMIYSLPRKQDPELRKNLRCLQDCIVQNPLFKNDRARLKKLQSNLDWLNNCCNSSVSSRPSKRKKILQAA